MIPRIYRLIPVIIAVIGCARQTTPEGGPKDLLPPKLVKSNPANNQKNVTEKTLTLTFSEFIKLKDPKEQIIITPEPPKDIQFLAKQNRLTIETKTGWQDSTTYSFTFRDGVQDITESNSVENLKLAFSTGPVIDSLILEGKIVDALTEKIPENITVAIFQSDTFNIFKHKPVYFTKTNKLGKFKITNLKSGKYKIYAFDDKNKNLKVESKTEMLGFTPGRLTLPGPNDSLTLILLRMDARPIRLTSVRHTTAGSTIKLNKPVVSYSIILPDKKIQSAFGDDQSEINLYHSLNPTDSLPIKFHAVDSLDQKTDTTVYIKGGTNTPVPAKLKFDVANPSISPETSILVTTIKFSKPLKSYLLDSIFLAVDSTTTIPFTSTDLAYDTATKKLQLTKQLDQKLLKSLTTTIQLNLAKAAFISIENDTTAAVKKPALYPKPEDTATLFVEIKTAATDYEVQLVTDTYKPVQSVRNNKNITFKNLLPVDYKIRAYIDTNGNHQWDPGNYYLDIPPEPIYYYQTPAGKFQFPLRANWEVGPYVFQF